MRKRLWRDEAIIRADTKLTFKVTGASAMDTSGITVSIFKGEDSQDFALDITNTKFTAPTGDSKDAELVVALTGNKPDMAVTGSASSFGLRVVIPKESFTGFLAGCNAPSTDITFADELKLDVQSASTGGT